LLLHTSLLSLFFTAPATTAIYTLSLHDALPICLHAGRPDRHAGDGQALRVGLFGEQALHVHRRHVALDEIALHLRGVAGALAGRSEEHTSELQSRENLVCRLLLEKKKKNAQ